MIENQFSCGLIPEEIAKEALKNFQRHDHQTERIKAACFKPRSLIDCELQEHIKRVVEDITWRQMLSEFPHAVLKVRSDHD